MSNILFGKKESDTRFNVSTIHYQPDKLSEKQKERGLEVDESAMPEKPDTGKGESTSMFADPETGEVWYEVVERDLNEEEKDEIEKEKMKDDISNIKNQLSDIKKKL